MLKLRHRLTIAITLLIFIVMGGLGFTLSELYENFYIHNLTDRLKKEADLAAHFLIHQQMSEQDIQLFTTQLSEKLKTRVTVILENGEVVGESDADLAMMERHDLRPEIHSLLSGEYAETIRYSQTLGEEMLYYAVSVKRDGEDLWGYLRLGLPTTALAKVNKTASLILFISFALAFLIIVFLSFRMTRQMISPIENVTNVANELAKGNYQSRAPEEKKDEIGQLTKSINVLAYQLEQVTSSYKAQQEQMKTLIENMGSGLIFINSRGETTLMNEASLQIFPYVKDQWANQLYYHVIKEKEVVSFIQNVFLTEKKQRIQVDILIHTDIHHYDLYGAPIVNKNGEVRGVVIVLHEITELKKLEQMRKDFVANVSHELRTPVTSIRGFVETLLDESLETEAMRKQFLLIIQKDSERLQRLIAELLELSRIEQSQFTLNWQMCDAGNILIEVKDLLYEKAMKKRVELVIHKSGDAIIEVDSERLKQILINLVTNAITHSKEGEKVQMNFVQMGDEAMFEVVDSGSGIAENELPRIFERFYRVDKARARDSGGTGLGLAIVKHLVEAHHGHISAESIIDKGTTFTITLKRKRNI